MQEQLLDNRRRLYLHLVSQLFDCKALWQRDNLNLLFTCIFRLFLRLDELTGLILALDILNILAVLFIDQIFAVPLILLLTDAAFLLISMLLGIFNRAFRHKSALSTLVAKSAFIVSPAIKSLSGSIALTLTVTALAVIPIIITVIVEITLAVAALAIVAVIVTALTIISVIVIITLSIAALAIVAVIVAALTVISVIVPIIISIVIPVIVKITLAVAALVFTPVIIPIIVEITLTVAALVFTPVIMLTPIISLCWF